MKIAIDMQACLTDSRSRGIGRYALGLVEAMFAQAGGDVEIVACLDSTDPERAQNLRRMLRTRCPGLRTLSYCYPHNGFTDQSPALHRAASLLKTEFYRACEPDALLVTSFFEFGTNYSVALDNAALKGILTVVVAYDLIPLIFPERYLPEGHYVSTWYRERVEEFKRFDLFLAISEATRHDLIQYLGIPPNRICVIGAGLDATLANTPPILDDRSLSGLGIRGPYVLTVGNGDWRKNCLGSLRAFADLPTEVRDRHQLVLTQVGEDVLMALQDEYSWLKDQVVIAGKVPEQLLAQLYRHCKVFYFPSLYEGFGLPVLEAMALDAPVLSSSLGALSEVVHNQSLLFDPRDRKAGSEVLHRALIDDDFREELRRGAKEHALGFTWEKCASSAMVAISNGSSKHTQSSHGAWWEPGDHEIGYLADAVLEAGQRGLESLRHSLEAVTSRGRRRILVDISEVARMDARSGIQRVVRNYCAALIEQMNQEGSQFRVEPIQWTEEGITYAREFCRDRLGVDAKGKDLPVTIEADDLVFMVDSSWWAPERFTALHQAVKSAGGEVVWMVYDLVPVLTPQFCDPGMPPVFRAWLDHVARTADGCICISRTTEIELQRYLDVACCSGSSRPWTRFVHLGSDLDADRSAAASPDVLALTEKLHSTGYCLALSTLEPRKDYPTILSAFELLWAVGKQLSLVIVGKKGWQVEALEARIRSHPELGRRLHWLERATDGDVLVLFSGAKALLQASLAEGYGLAVAEAGSLGVPLILSDLPVFREIASDQAQYFPPGDASRLGEILISNLENGAWYRPDGLIVDTWAESTSKLVKCLRF